MGTIKTKFKKGTFVDKTVRKFLCGLPLSRNQPKNFEKGTNKIKEQGGWIL